MTVPGVNLICAATFVAAVGNANRFLTSRKLVAYLGLDPQVRQSGEAPAHNARIPGSLCSSTTHTACSSLAQSTPATRPSLITLTPFIRPS
jgi:transposase